MAQLAAPCRYENALLRQAQQGVLFLQQPLFCLRSGSIPAAPHPAASSTLPYVPPPAGAEKYAAYHTRLARSL